MLLFLPSELNYFRLKFMHLPFKGSVIGNLVFQTFIQMLLALFQRSQPLLQYLSICSQARNRGILLEYILIT